MSEKEQPDLDRPERAAGPEAADAFNAREEYAGYHERAPDEATPEGAEARREAALQPGEPEAEHARRPETEEEEESEERGEET